MTDEILTIREMAEPLKINEKTAYKLVSAGKIPGFKVGGSWRFERQENLGAVSFQACARWGASSLIRVSED